MRSSRRIDEFKEALRAEMARGFERMDAEFDELDSALNIVPPRRRFGGSR